MLIVVIAITAILTIWALFGLWGAHTYRSQMTPEEKSVSDMLIANRKAYIIEDGQRKHAEWQKNHPLLRWFFTYKPDKYFRDNQLNTKRYPY